MIPSLHFGLVQINFLCQDLQKELLNKQVVDCFKIDPYRFALIFEDKNVQKTLFFCFQPLFLRFHLVAQKFKAHLSPLSAHLKGAKLISIDVVNQDRIVCLEFQLSTHKRSFLFCEFFSKYPNFYLTNADHQIIFSLHQSKEKTYSVPTHQTPKHFSTSPLMSHKELEEIYQKKEKEWQLTQDKNQVQSFLNKQLKKLLSKRAVLEKQLQACQNWEAVQHKAELIKAHLGQYKKGIQQLIVWDWLIDQEVIINLNPPLTILEEMGHYYKTSKKLFKGLEHIQNQLKLTLYTIQILEVQIENLVHLSEEEISKTKALLFPHQSNQELELKKEKKTLPYYEYFSEQNVPIWVGKNAKANEILTFRFANGNDWWLHASGVPGSHVVIKLVKKKEPDPETLQDAIQLALFHSKAKTAGEGEVCITQKKYVTRLGKGKVGKVQISQHNNLYVRLDLKRYARIKERR